MASNRSALDRLQNNRLALKATDDSGAKDHAAHPNMLTPRASVKMFLKHKMRFRAANIAYFAVAFFGAVLLVNGMTEVLPSRTYDSIVGISV